MNSFAARCWHFQAAKFVRQRMEGDCARDQFFEVHWQIGCVNVTFVHGRDGMPARQTLPQVA